MDRYIRIYKESDFDFQYKLDSAHLSTPFKFIFFTTDINESSYECSFDGTTYYRCTRVDEDSIVFHIDGNTFECGNLRIRKEYFIDSSSFEDGICNSVDVEKTNIYIIEEGSNANSVVYCGSTLPNFDPMLIEQNVERAIIILNEKSDEVDQQLSYVILVKDEMEDLLSYATEWEDRLENIESTYATQSYVQNKIDSIDFSPYPTFTDISNMGYLTSIPSEYITQEELSSNAYLTQHQSLSNYPTFTDISNMGYATQTYVQDKINDIPSPDLSSYATKSYVVDYVATYAPKPDLSPYPTYSYTNKVYVTYSYLDDVVQDIVVGHVDLRDYVKKEDLDEAGYISSIPSEYITQTKLSANAYLTQHQDLSSYATKSYVSEYVATYAPEPDLSAYVTKTELNNAGYISSIPSEYITQAELSSNSYLTHHQSLDGYATEAYVVNYVATYAPEPDLSSYVTKTELSNAGYITYIPDDYITQLELSSNSYATKSYVVDYVVTYAPLPDLSSYVTYSYLEDKHYLDSIPSEYITQNELSANAYLTYHQDLSNYPTYSYVNEVFPTYSYVDDRINNIQQVVYQTIPIWKGTYTQYQNLPDYTSYELYLIKQE